MRAGRTLAMLCPVVAILLSSTACGAANPTEPTPGVTPAAPSSSSPVPSGSPAAPVLDLDERIERQSRPWPAPVRRGIRRRHR